MYTQPGAGLKKICKALHRNLEESDKKKTRTERHRARFQLSISQRTGTVVCFPVHTLSRKGYGESLLVPLEQLFLVLQLQSVLFGTESMRLDKDLALNAHA